MALPVLLKPENNICFRFPEQGDKNFICPSRKRGFFMAIYTRSGDKGKTSLLKGKRVSKSDLRIEVLGSIDELNSTIGVVLSSKYQVLTIKKELIEIQKDLFNINSCLADPSAKCLNLSKKWLLTRVNEIEQHIDEMTIKMPVLKHFILPGGGETGARLHLARTVCRRAERSMVLLNKKEKINTEIINYLNRLSDLLFTMARFSNFKEKKKEQIWKEF